MSNHPVSVILSALETVTGRKPGRNRRGWIARCPAHNDRKPSLSISEGDDGKALVHCHAGCSVEAIVLALGLTLRDLMAADDVGSDQSGLGRQKPRIPSVSGTSAGRTSFATASDAVADLENKHGKSSACWTYHDAKGEPVGVVARWDRPAGKDFRPVSRNGDGWIIGGMPTPRPLYRLPDLAAAQRVFICEGEKAADAVGALGLIATTSPHGSKSARKADWSVTAGKECIVMPDNDDAGRGYADDVVGLLGRITPRPTVKRIELPELPPGGDVVEFIEARRAARLDDAAIRAELERLADEAPARESSSVTSAREPVLVRLNDVRPEPVRWLWPGRIAMGKLTLIPGDPGLGKSLVTLDIAARVSCGRRWPDGSEAPTGGIVLLSAEDDLADTIRPRLDAAGAEVSRIVAIQAVRTPDHETGGERSAPFTLSNDLAALEGAIASVENCVLVVIDPISAYLGGDPRFDSHRNSDVRAVLAPLAELAARHGVAVVAVTHLRKGEGPALYRAMGSLAFVAAARAVWAITRDKDDPTGRRRLFLAIKNNIAVDQSGLAFALHDAAGGIPCVAWEPEPVSVPADDALARDHSRTDQEDREDATEFLQQALAEGEQPAMDILKQARANGFTDKAARKALRALGGKRRRSGFGPGGTWLWSLPNSIVAPVDAIGAHTLELGNNGTNAATVGGGPDPGCPDGERAPDEIRFADVPRADPIDRDEWGEL